MTTALLRLTEAQVLPFEFRNVARAVEAWAADLPKADLTALQAELKRLQSTAEAYEERFGRQRNPSAELNAALIRTERALLDPDGLTGRQWYKHQLMAPGRYTGYSAKTLPAIRDSDDPQAGVARVAAALRRYSEAVEEATRLLTQ
jgi:N-acetylated-alpha-linked acidic dipeptidase